MRTDLGTRERGTTMKIRAVAAACVSLGLLAGCGGQPSPDEARAHVKAEMQGRLGGLGREIPYDTLADLLPNVKYARPGEPGQPATANVVIGRVTSVAKGQGWKPTAEDGDGVRTSFDDPQAQAKTVHLMLDVLRPIGPRPNEPGQLRVGLAVNATTSFDALSVALRSFDRVVLFLFKGSAVFDYDPSLYAILEDGGLFATVDGEGRLALPFVDADRVPKLLRLTPTLADLVAMERAPDRTINLRR